MSAIVLATAGWETFAQHCLIGLTVGSLFALIALGYTMVYGISELVNFAHGDLFMLGAFLTLTLAGWLGLAAGGPLVAGAGIIALLIVVPCFCGTLNLAVDRVVYRPLRNNPSAAANPGRAKLAALVSALGVSFVFMNAGLFWGGAADRHFPELLPRDNLLGESAIRFTLKDLLVVAVTVPLMIGLTLFIRYTRLGKAMRATAQNPTAARLMGIDVDRVIGATFLIGGGLGGAASVIYVLYINTLSFQMGFQNGLYAFTAAVLGGIGKIPGAVLGGLILGLVRSLGSAYVDERWTSALIFGILIVLLVFRPAGLLGAARTEKV
jgi:branched-chain amino acid transport system permease protein